MLAARGLGVDGFGTFAGVVALVALVSPFGSLGALGLMLRDVARRPESAPEQYATAVLITVVLGSAVTGLVAVAAAYVGPSVASTSVVVWLAAGDLLAYRLVELAGAVGQARDRILGTAAYPSAVLAARLLVVLLLLASGHGADLEVWAAAYGVASLAVAVPIVMATARRVGVARPAPRRFLAQWRDGLLFAFGMSAQGAYNDIDKVMLARLGSVDAVGVYAAAYRLVDMAFIPMRALLTASYARFFRAGERGLAGSAMLARQLLLPSLAMSFGASLVLLFGADLVVLLLGPEFSDAVGILRMLAVIPLLRALHYLAADALSGAGLQGTRTIVQICVAVVNVSLNLLLIPLLGAEGAAWASIASDGLLALLLWVVVVRRLRPSVRTSPIEPAAF